ncbi:MAG: hypothetical protein K9J16_02935 [Melioribacteraceae bacterium]|nr:hypothetical protein [Melioribacteraceae bacterium]MCF8355454.1 hypothetical protein [Melioribacteraceae bacterium]MCF8392569.1 hypothetical protein [Melioribacteraceae bacterium]MCF8418416.1 hypothetical protein [Melioribacteraceae bacterium]
MTPKNSLKPLAVTFAASGVWDTVAGILYLFFIGTGRLIDSPHTHSFYSIFLASFFFCFAYLQFMSSLNIERYTFVVGSLIIGRIFYVIQLYLYMLFYEGFPSTFWFTGIIDAIFTLSYFIFAFRGGLGFKDLFLPVREKLRTPYPPQNESAVVLKIKRKFVPGNIV